MFQSTSSYNCDWLPFDTELGYIPRPSTYTRSWTESSWDSGMVCRACTSCANGIALRFAMGLQISMTSDSGRSQPPRRTAARNTESSDVGWPLACHKCKVAEISPAQWAKCHVAECVFRSRGYVVDFVRRKQNLSLHHYIRDSTSIAWGPYIY